MPIRLPSLAAALALPCLAACTQTGSPAPTAAALPAPSVPSGPAGCAREIAAFRAAVDSDKETGNIAASVHRVLAAEADEAARTCAAGQDGAALRRLASVKGRYGYR